MSSDGCSPHRARHNDIPYRLSDNNKRPVGERVNGGAIRSSRATCGWSTRLTVQPGR